MSNGIEIMKEKIRKKMTLDDLPSPKQNKPSEEKVAVHKEVHTAVQPHSNTSVQQDGEIEKGEIKGAGDLVAQTAIQQNVRMRNFLFKQEVEKTEPHANVLLQSNTVLQQSAEVEKESIGVLSEEEVGDKRIENSNAVIQQNSDNENTSSQRMPQETHQLLEQQNSNPAKHQNIKEVIQQNSVVMSIPRESLVYKTNQPSEQQDSNTAKPHNVVGASFSNQAIEKNKTVYGRKMTLYLTEEMYKAFNDIYANRMLEGRKTEKSALICEAVELLRKHEN